MEKQLDSSVIIRPMILEDIPAVIELQKRSFQGGMSVWSADQLTNHLAIFPEGQLVAVDSTNKILASASSIIIDWDDYAASAQWATITGHGTFNTHNPLGKTLYGADLSVDPLARRKGIGSLLYQARKKMVKDRDLKRFLTGGRIPGYALVSKEISPKQYVAEVIQGKRKDPTLNFQLKNGFVVLDIVQDYLPDGESLDYATLLEWLNPEYIMHMSLLSEEENQIPIEISNLEEPIKYPRTRRVRIAAMQYLLRPISCFEDFATQVEFFVHSAKDYDSHFVVFPELFTMQLLSYMNEPGAARAVRLLAQQTPEYEKLFKRLATENNLYIIAGTHPVIQQGELFNAAHLFTPNGLIFRQKKVHLTPVEKISYQMSRGMVFMFIIPSMAKLGFLFVTMWNFQKPLV